MKITVVTTRNILVPNMSFRNKGHGRLCTNSQSSKKWIILGTVTLKSWFLNPGIIKQKYPFSYSPYYSLTSKLIDVLSHSGHSITLVLPKKLWYI